MNRPPRCADTPGQRLCLCCGASVAGWTCAVRCCMWRPMPALCGSLCWVHCAHPNVPACTSLHPPSLLPRLCQSSPSSLPRTTAASGGACWRTLPRTAPPCPTKWWRSRWAGGGVRWRAGGVCRGAGRRAGSGQVDAECPSPCPAPNLPCSWPVLPGLACPLPDPWPPAQIYGNVAAGFTDANPYLRELTLKSMAVLAPKLSQKAVSQSLLKHLAKLQVGGVGAGPGGRACRHQAGQCDDCSRAGAGQGSEHAVPFSLPHPSTQPVQPLPGG